MTDQELAGLEARERELSDATDKAEAAYKAVRREWADVWQKIKDEETRRRYFAEFQKAQAPVLDVDTAGKIAQAALGAAGAGTEAK